MIEHVAVFVVALAILAFASHRVIRGAIRIADFFGIGESAMGFIMIATFTSLPELAVSSISAFQGNGGIAVGNVLGSNVVNILLVLGILAAFGHVRLKRAQIVDNAEILLLITLLPFMFLITGSIEYVHGLFLIFVFILYAFFAVKEKIKFRSLNHVRAKDWLLDNINFWGGMVVVVIAADFVVGSAVGIASVLEFPNVVIGATLIAFGTSLPELAIGLQAVRKGYKELALSEVIGSCVINLTLVLGVAAIIAPLVVQITAFTTTLFFLLLTNALLSYLLIKFSGLKKRHGMMFILLYVVFLMAEMSLGITL